MEHGNPYPHSSRPVVQFNAHHNIIRKTHRSEEEWEEKKRRVECQDRDETQDTRNTTKRSCKRGQKKKHRNTHTQRSTCSIALNPTHSSLSRWRAQHRASSFIKIPSRLGTKHTTTCMDRVERSGAHGTKSCRAGVFSRPLGGCVVRHHIGHACMHNTTYRVRYI